MTLSSTFRDNKAVYTIAGAGDLAVEKLRELPEQATKVQSDVRDNVGKYRVEVRKTVDRYRVQARRNVEKYRGEAQENITRLQDRIEVKDLPGAAVAYATHFGTRAVELIDELAERGKKVVHRTAAEVAESAESVAEVTAGDQAKPASAAKATRARKAAAQQTKSPASARKNS
ncbi:hypothetical protein GCM10009678_71190 [Actinomadura kijaniata]|uniref:Heparin binding hemagglutinin HbhA n=1 Tax=Actinomadura namibiensis TaxID=182080 RepID=A0A7W3LWM6_ACTNM|nr:hypothetical protein [Actinomadura namibiensis]MBA8955597.1 hypothetical protein [Actinomadura namibiensis]